MANVAHIVGSHALHTDRQSMFHLKELMQSILPLHIFLEAARVSKVNRNDPLFLNHVMNIFLVLMSSGDGAKNPFIQRNIGELQFFLVDNIVFKFCSNVLDD